MSNSLLYRDAQQGSTAARTALIELLKSRIESLARYYGRVGHALPDDLEQEAWAAIISSLDSLDPSIGSPRMYLIERARFRILDVLKRESRRRAARLDDEIVDERSATASSECETRLFAAQIASRLPAIQRQIFEALLAGHTWREIAKMLGCSSANVAYHVKKIRFSLAKTLAHSIEQLEAPR